MVIDNQTDSTDGQIKRLVSELTRAAGESPHYVCLRQVTPLNMTVAYWEEAAAYKLAYAYREHAQSRVTVEIARGPAMPGAYLVVLTPR